MSNKKKDEKKQAQVMIETALHRRSCAQRLLEEAEQDLVKAKQLMEEAEGNA